MSHRHLRLVQFLGDGLLDVVDHPGDHLPAAFDLGVQFLERARLQRLERQLFQLVLDDGHAEAIGDGGVDVEGFLGDAGPALLGQVVERPHVVQAVGQLHHDDPDVVHHGEQHFPEVFRLPLLFGRERDGAQLRDPFDDVGHVGAEGLLDFLDGGEGVLYHVVQEAGGDGDDVQPHVGEDVGHFQRMDEVGLTGVAHLSLVLEGGKHVGPSQQFDVRFGVVDADFFDQVLEPNHGYGV